MVCLAPCPERSGLGSARSAASWWRVPLGRWMAACAIGLLGLGVAVPVPAEIAARELPAPGRDTPVLAPVTAPALIGALFLGWSQVSIDNTRMRQLRPASDPLPAADRTRPPGRGLVGLRLGFQHAGVAPTPAARADLEQLAQALQSDELVGFDFRIHVLSADTGLALARQRAEQIVHQLTDQAGVLPERLHVAPEVIDADVAAEPDDLRLVLVTVPPDRH